MDFYEIRWANSNKKGNNKARRIHAYPDTAHNSLLILCAKVQNRMYLTGRRGTQKIGKSVVLILFKHSEETVFAGVLPRHPASFIEFGAWAIRMSQQIAFLMSIVQHPDRHGLRVRLRV